MDPLFDFTDKVVMVTGGSRGLGYQMVRAFAERGADVVITSRKKESCDSVAREVRALGRRALAYGCHVGHWQELDGLVEAAYSEFGQIDVLINNAGMSPVTPTSADVTEELFDKIIGVNFKGPFRLASLVGHRMAAADGGSIINVSSSGALRPIPTAIPYCGAKAALNAMTEAFAAEFGAAGVRVNTLSAGPFLTDISKAWSEKSRTSSPAALGRPGKPDEVVTTALFLASPHSSFVTSCLARVDGGLY
jgi:NAD(P)-dependent dehydrogenase (short-subunit alcohol dehydrogenase family)